MSDKNIFFYLKLFLNNIPFAITPFIGMLYFIITIPITSGISIIEASAYSQYATISTMIIFSFAAMPPSVMQFTKGGLMINTLAKTLLVWSVTLSVVTLCGLILIAHLLNDDVIQKTSLYFLCLIPEIVLSVLCGLWSAILVLNKKGNELFRVGIVMLALKLFIFFVVIEVTSSVFALIVVPNLIIATLYYFVLYKKSRAFDIVVGTPNQNFTCFKFLKNVHTDSLDAIVISITFMYIVWMAGTISESAIIFSAIIMTTIRMIVLPMKRFGYAYGFELSRLKENEVKLFVFNTLKAKYVSLVVIVPLVYGVFTFTNSNIDNYNANMIFLIILSQLVVEPITSYLTSLSKYIGLGYKNLKYTAIYQWGFCIPLIYGLQSANFLTLETLWGVMVVGRWGFAMFYCVCLYKCLNVQVIIDRRTS